MSDIARTKQVGIVGGGIAGLTAAYELQKARGSGFPVTWQLLEASGRLGGIVETHQQDGFTVECGPDGWLSEKPAARALAMELGLGSELIPSLDSARRTYLLHDGQLTPIPDGMRLMVPTDLDAVDRSTLFSAEAKSAFRLEPLRAEALRAGVPSADESISSFVRRHFGEEVLQKVGAPLLSGIFGGDPATLSVRAVMPLLVALEREFGSLVTALSRPIPTRDPGSTLFTSLRRGVGSLVGAVIERLPPDCVRMFAAAHRIHRSEGGWIVELADHELLHFDELVLATPAHVTAKLLDPISPRAAALLPDEASSAIIVAFGFPHAEFALPPGFGFLVPADGPHHLLACTFTEQKYPHRAPAGGRLLRAFFGGRSADALVALSDEQLSELALQELRTILGTLPEPAFRIVRRWPRSLPQYAVGHLERMAELFSLVSANLAGVTLLGNSYLGVGLPDLIRDARAAVHRIVSGEAF